MHHHFRDSKIHPLTPTLLLHLLLLTVSIMPPNIMPQRPTNHNIDSHIGDEDDDDDGEDNFSLPTDPEAFRRDQPLMAGIDAFANYYVNSVNTCPERVAHLYEIFENPNYGLPPIVYERIAATRAMLSSTATKYSFCPIRRIVCCCCPNTITGHVEHCCPIPVQDIASLARDHPTEFGVCFYDFLSFFVTFNNCTTDDERDALMAPYEEKIFILEALCGSCRRFNRQD